MLAMALTKGRLEKQSVKLLEQSGYGIEALKNKGRALVFPDSKKDISYFLVKANDCVTYVEHGVADIGVVGKDTLLESNAQFYEVMDLGIGKCRFILASLPEKQRNRITSHFLLGMSLSEIAKSEGSGVSSVHEGIQRGLRRLKKVLEKMETDPENNPQK